MKHLCKTLLLAGLVSGCAGKVAKPTVSSARVSHAPQSAQLAEQPFTVAFTNVFWDYRVESSTNLVTWQGELSGSDGVTNVTFLDFFASVPRKFYRLVSGGLRAGKSVTLAWDANPETDLVGYRLEARTTNAAPLVIDVGNQTTNTVTGLIEAKTYFFTVRAYNLAGLESEPSNEVSCLIQRMP